MTGTKEIAVYRRRTVKEAIQRGEIPFIPFAHFRRHIEAVARGQIPAAPFTTFFDLFDEEQDTPRLHLFRSKSSPSGISEPFLFRRVEVNHKCRKIPQVTFAGISMEDGAKTIGISIHEQNLRGTRVDGFNYTVISDTPNHHEATIIPINSPQGGSITITYLVHPDQTFALRCGEQIFAMARLGTLQQKDETQHLGMGIAIFPDVLIPRSAGI